MDDWALLEEYRRDESRTALDALVRRHSAMVYAAACREVGGDTHLADDVTQAVFLVLMRRARHLSKRVTLAGWLFKVTRYAAADARKAAARRARHHREAALRNDRATSSAAAADVPAMAGEIAPLLNDAIASLPRAEREAIVLRYLEDKTNEQVAGELRLTETAARQRVFRALGKLRERFQRNGINAADDVLGAALLVIATQHARPDLAAALSASLYSPSPAAQAFANQAIRSMTMTMIKTAAFTFVLAGLLITAAAMALLKPDGSGSTPPQAASPTTAPTTAPSVAVVHGPATTPRGTVIAAYEAALAGDEEGFLRCFENPTATQQATLRMVVHGFAATNDLATAVRDQFGPDAAQQFFRMTPLVVKRADLDDAAERIDGATADVDLHGIGPGIVPVTRAGDVWLISGKVLDTLNTSMVAAFDHQTAAIHKIADDTRAGKYDTLQNVQNALGALMAALQQQH